VRKAYNLPPSCAVVTKSGEINFLEIFGPVQACNGAALPFNIIHKPLHWLLPFQFTDLYILISAGRATYPAILIFFKLVALACGCNKSQKPFNAQFTSSPYNLSVFGLYTFLGISTPMQN